MKEYNDFFSLIHPLSEVVKKAATVIMDIYDENGYEVTIKADDSPVTQADIAANDIICNGLLQIDRNFNILSEENMQISYDERKNYEYFWLIDPLDGTKEFVKRNGEFTINVSLVHKNKAILGIVAVPAHNELYYAVAGHGAFMEKNLQTCRLQCSSFKHSLKGLRIPCSLSHINQDTRDFIAQLTNLG